MLALCGCMSGAFWGGFGDVAAFCLQSRVRNHFLRNLVANPGFQQFSFDFSVMHAILDIFQCHAAFCSESRVRNVFLRNLVANPGFQEFSFDFSFTHAILDIFLGQDFEGPPPQMASLGAQDFEGPAPQMASLGAAAGF